jgi:hypothetical protein
MNYPQVIFWKGEQRTGVWQCLSYRMKRRGRVGRIPQSYSRSSPIRTSALGPKILTENFRDFHQSLQENAGIMPQIRPQPSSFTSFNFTVY